MQTADHELGSLYTVYEYGKVCKQGILQIIHLSPVVHAKDVLSASSMLA